jgi:hypothetical protein
MTLYADADGALSLHRTEGATEVPFELADGYRVGPGFTGVLAIFGPHRHARHDARRSADRAHAAAGLRQADRHVD